MVLADSRRITRQRRYSGTLSEVCSSFVYGALTPCGSPFQNDSTTAHVCNFVEDLALLLRGPTTPDRQRHQAIPPARFRLFPFRSPLLRESRLLSFPTGYLDVSVHLVPSTGAMCSHRSDTSLQVSGFPIRTSPDQSSVGSSPRLIAASHVLHRS